MNLQDENPTIAFGPDMEDKSKFPPPFFIALTIHDKMLHTCLLDSSASHNLIPKVVMEALGLNVTKPYHDSYSFDSKEVKCFTVIRLGC